MSRQHLPRADVRDLLPRPSLKLTNHVDARRKRVGHRLVLVGLEALDDDLGEKEGKSGRERAAKKRPLHANRREKIEKSRRAATRRAALGLVPGPSPA